MCCGVNADLRYRINWNSKVLLIMAEVISDFFSFKICSWNKELLFSLNLRALWNLQLYPNIYFEQRGDLLSLFPQRYDLKARVGLSYSLLYWNSKHSKQILRKMPVMPGMQPPDLCLLWRTQQGTSWVLPTPCVCLGDLLYSIFQCLWDGKVYRVAFGTFVLWHGWLPLEHAGFLLSLVFDTCRTRV